MRIRRADSGDGIRDTLLRGSRLFARRNEMPQVTVTMSCPHSSVVEILRLYYCHTAYLHRHHAISYQLIVRVRATTTPLERYYDAVTLTL